MKYDEHLEDKITDYLSGRLSAEVVNNFEKEIVENATLAKLVELNRMSKKAVDREIERDFREKMENWEKEIPATSPSFLQKNKWLILGFIGLLAILFYWFSTNSDQNPINTFPIEIPEKESKPNLNIVEDDGKEKGEEPIEEIKKEPEFTPKPPQKNHRQIAFNFHEDPSFLGNKKNTDEPNSADSLFNLAKTAYQNKDYKKTIEILRTSLVTPNEKEKETLAHAYFKSKQFGKATQLFREILAEETFNPDIPQWYLLLSLAAEYEKNKKEVHQMIEEISADESHNFYESVLELKEKL